MTNGNDDDKTRPDLTRIEDLSEYLHPEDADVDDMFGDFDQLSDGQNEPETNETLPELPEVEEIENDEFSMEVDEAMPSIPDSFTESSSDIFSDANDELNFSEELPETETDFNFQTENVSETDDNSPFELSDSQPEENDNFSLTALEESNDFIAETIVTEEPAQVLFKQAESLIQERFEEVKNFAQNFSYGQIQGGGNPPFSLIIRNLKYSDEASDILIILRDFGIVTDQTSHEMTKSLELGSLLVPQIGEYSAIILAHKLRRFDCDIEVGLSDEVHPSKSGETNPRGLMKKDSLKQNIVEKFHKSESDIPIKDIIVSTTNILDGYIIKKYIGVQTSFAIVDEEELERLKFVQQTARSSAQLENYETDDASNISSEKAFKDYQNSFDLLFTDLCDQLKVKAMKEKANALLGLNYQLTSLPFEKNNHGKNCYQLTCTATLAIVGLDS